MTTSSSQPYHVGSENDCSLTVKFVSAGIAACISDIITYPLDVAKVRLQIQKSCPDTQLLNDTRKMYAQGSYIHSPTPFRNISGMMNTLKEIFRQKGFRALYAGLPAGLQRQLLFSSIRIGLYDEMKTTYQRLLKHDTNERPKVYVRILSGLTTGAISVTLAQPTEVVKVRMQAAVVEKRPVYRSVMSAYHQIVKSEGLTGLWRGYVPNMVRNSITGVSELVTYDLTKEYILKRNWMSDSFPCHVVSGLTAGFVATVISSPVDVIKTRFMSAFMGEYSGVLQCASELIKENGPSALYKGFIPAFIRLGSWNILTFVCFEQLKFLLSKDFDFRSSLASFQHPMSSNKKRILPSNTAQKKAVLVTSQNDMHHHNVYQSVWNEV